MKLELDDPQLKSLISEAIFASLTQEKKDALISAAVSGLMAPEHNYGGKTVTALQREFHESIRQMARELIDIELQGNTEIKEKINGMIRDAVILMTETNREATVNKMSEAIYRGLTAERY